MTRPTRPNKTSPRLAHIPELDGIRGIAAVMVLCHHLFYTSVPHPERWNRFVQIASSLCHAGGYGVDLFFVLSGYLITSLLLLDRPSPHLYWNFYWKRALRILPLYLVALICLVAVLPSSWRYAMLSLFFLANFAQLFHVASVGPFWTLAIEEQFYLLWPRFTRNLTLAGLERLALGLVLACPILRLVDVAFHHYNYEFTFFHCDGLALGAVLACRTLRNGNRTVSASPSARRRAAPWLLATLGLALSALPLVSNPETAGAHIAGALQLSGISLLGCSLVAAVVRHTGSPLLAVFRGPILTFLGLISYCLYIANGYVVTAYDSLRGPMATGDMRQYTLRAAAVCAITLLICVLSRFLIERPAISLRRYVLRQP